MKDVSMLILALEKLGVHIIFARIVGRVGKPETHIFFWPDQKGVAEVMPDGHFSR